MTRALCVLMVLVLALAGETGAEISLSPHWQVASSGYPTGVGWADLDGDGWLDLVVAQGLDVGFAPNVAFFNAGGKIATTPGWTSADTLSSGNLFLGDLNGDGRPDLLNANMGHGPTGRAAQPHTVYLNAGGLRRTPDWESPPANAFSCAAGDPDGDGDIDIAFGQGFSAVDPAESKRQKAVIYFNEGGSFGQIPGWQSDSVYIATEIAFADIDNDGDHDLALAGRGLGLGIFYNRDGRIETSPSWHHEGLMGGRQMAFGDVDGDGFPELALCGVAAYGAGGGKFLLFKNDGGVLRKEPVWTCGAYIEPSAVAWADVDGDGDLDLGGGGWNMHVGVFENRNGRLTDTYVWSHTPGWLQQIAWGDFDNSGLLSDRRELTGDGQRKLFDLGQKALHAISRVSVDGEILTPAEYCCDPVEGWISLAAPPRKGAAIVIDYVRSENLDLAVTVVGRTRIYKNSPHRIPSDVRILVVLDHNFGANYNFAYDHALLGRVSNNIRSHFEGYGWDITVAGLAAKIDSCSVSAAQVGSRSVQADILLTDIRDLSSYDCVTIIPGNDHSGLLGSPATLDLIRRAVDEGLVVSAWCRAVRVLARAGVLDGRRVVGHADYASEYEAAGATHLGDDHPPVIDANVVTSVRSRFYRTETCEAIARAVQQRRDADGRR